MDNNSDSDKSYDKISWKEFYIGTSDSDPEESAKDEKLVNNEEDDSVSEKSQNEPNDDIGETLEYISGNSSYSDDSVDEGSEDSVDASDNENDFGIDLLEYCEDENVAVSYKRNTLLVPSGAFDYPSQIKRRENMEIKDLVKDHVLPFLPAKSLARFKAVSKEWNRWISSPLLAHKQSYLFRSLTGFFCHISDRLAFVPVDKLSSGIPNPSLSFLPERVAIRSSCFGLLLCQALRDDDDYYVCNPANTEYRKIPKPSFYHGHDPPIVLAFEPSEMNIEAHFEVICAVPVMDSPMVYFEIYSSISNEWRLSSAECIEVDSEIFLGGGFYVNKIAYFVTDTGSLVGFDAKSEVCGVFSLPSGCEMEGVVTSIGGEMCYVHVSNDSDENVYDECDICVYGGMDMSLKKRISGVFDGLGIGVEEGWCRILPFVADDGDDVAILAGNVLVIYRLSEESGKIIGSVRDLEAKYLPFVSSLVHLPSE